MGADLIIRQHASGGWSLTFLYYEQGAGATLPTEITLGKPDNIASIDNNVMYEFHLDDEAAERLTQLDLTQGATDEPGASVACASER